MARWLLLYFSGMFVATFAIGFESSGFADQEEAANEPTSLELKVVADKDSHRQLEPIELTLDITNKGPKSAWFPYPAVTRPYNRFTVVVHRLGRDGERIDTPRTAYAGFGLESSVFFASNGGNCMRLEPGQTWRNTMHANLVYDMSIPGKYEIVVEVPFWEYDDEDPNANSHLWDPRTKLVTKSNPIVVTVERIGVPPPSLVVDGGE